MLKELVEDREKIAKLKYHRLNLLLQKQASTLEDAFLNDSFGFHFVMLTALLRYHTNLLVRQAELEK